MPVPKNRETAPPSDPAGPVHRLVADETWAAPDLTTLTPPGGAVVSAETAVVEDRYDTAAGTLGALGLELARQSRGPRPGWTLRDLDAGGADLRHSGDRRRRVPRTVLVGLPDALAGLEVVGRTGTTRVHHTLSDAGGRAVVEVVEERVRRTRTDGTVLRERRLRVSAQPGGDPRSAERISRRLQDSGARPAPDPTPPTTAGEDPVGGFVAAQSREVLRGWVLLHRDPDPALVHRTRTALRRLRSVLRALPDTTADPTTVQDDLGHLARGLGPVRDADVVGPHLAAEVAELAEELEPARVGAALTAHLHRQRSEALDHWRSLLGDARTQRGLARLLDWTSTPPRVERPPAKKLLARAERRVHRRVAEAGGRPEELHRARKAAKRWRHTAELLAGRPGAAKHRKRARKVQRRLGSLQDDRLAAATLRAAAGQVDGRCGFAFGLLAARAEQRTHRAAADSTSWWG